MGRVTVGVTVGVTTTSRKTRFRDGVRYKVITRVGYGSYRGGDG